MGIHSNALPVGQPFNPYAAPQAAPQVVATPAWGQPMDWEPGEVLKLAWDRFGRYAFVLIVGYLIDLVVTQGVSQGPVLALKLASPHDAASPEVAAASFACGIVGMVIGAFFMVGLLRVCLDAARGRPVRFATLFLGGDRFLAMTGLYFLMTLLIGIGFVLLIVPGVILAFGWSFAPLYVVDANLGPIAAMRASWYATKGQKGKIFGFAVMSFGVCLLGLLACGIGVIPATSVTYVAWAAAFTRVSGREPALPADVTNVWP
jgi:uncharacterized membrane protein